MEGYTRTYYLLTKWGDFFTIEEHITMCLDPWIWIYACAKLLTTHWGIYFLLSETKAILIYIYIYIYIYINHSINAPSIRQKASKYMWVLPSFPSLIRLPKKFNTIETLHCLKEKEKKIMNLLRMCRIIIENQFFE